MTPSPTLIAPDEESPHVLRPYDPREACSVREAAAFLRVSQGHARRVVRQFCIGRAVLDGRLYVSRVGLHILAERDQAALDAFHAGRRDDPVLRPYLALAGLAERPRMAKDADFAPAALRG